MLPRIKTTSKKSTKSQSAFFGLDRSETPPSGSFSDCTNVTSKSYPFVSSRSPRYKKAEYNGSIQEMSADNNLYYIYTDENGKHLNYNSNSIKIADDTTAESFTAQIPGTVFIMPEKKLYHIEDNTLENLEKAKHFNGTTAYEKCSQQRPDLITGFDNGAVAEANRTGIHSLYIGTASPFYHIDFGTDFKVGEILNIKMKVWPEPADYTQEYYELVEKYEKGINLELKGITKTRHKISSEEITEYTSLLFDENSFTFEGYENLYIWDITIERTVPDLADVCAYNNRLWGVTKHSIHTSRLGDGGEWNDFSQDSYGTLPDACFTCEVDTRAEFTGICAYNGNILAFKENCIHKIYGDQPDNYTIVTIDAPGLEKGAKNTLITLNGALYYKGINGIYEYTSGMPRLISEPLGNIQYKAKYAASDGICYYIALEHDNVTKLYCYNPVYKTWHTEDLSTNTEYIYGYENSIYLAADGVILTTDKSCELYEYDVMWDFKLKFDENTYNRKCYTRLKLNYSLSKDAYFYVYIYYDNELVKKYAFSDFTPDENGQAFVPLPHRGCKDITIMFKGCSDFKLKNLTREFIVLNEGGK